MKVLFTARATLYKQPGGDTQQITQTAEALRMRGHFVDVKLNGETFSLNDYDIVHCFNAGRPADFLKLIQNLNKPLISSSVWVDYSEWDKKQSGFRGFLSRTLGNFGFEYLKTLARGLNGSDKMPTFKYIVQGHKASMRQLLNKSDAIISSSKSEKRRLNSRFKTANKTAIVPLGLNEHLIGKPEAHDKEDVICVGRIEGLKNQLAAIKAANGARFKLNIIGKPALNQPEYYRACQLAATSNVEFKGWLNAAHLVDAYQSAKVLVLPSYFETFGLVALEAYANGCNLVLSNRADMNEIFKDKALFCNPDDENDIREKIEEALKLDAPRLSTADLDAYNWQQIAAQIEQVYNSCLDK